MGSWDVGEPAGRNDDGGGGEVVRGAVWCGNGSVGWAEAGC